jgi:hypothetical protein
MLNTIIELCMRQCLGLFWEMVSFFVVLPSLIHPSIKKIKLLLTKHFLELRTPWRSLIMKPSTSLHSIIYYNMIFLFICFFSLAEHHSKACVILLKLCTIALTMCQIELHEGYLMPRILYCLKYSASLELCSKSITHLQNL